MSGIHEFHENWATTNSNNSTVYYIADDKNEYKSIFVKIRAEGRTPLNQFKNTYSVYISRRKYKNKKAKRLDNKSIL